MKLRLDQTINWNRLFVAPMTAGLIAALGACTPAEDDAPAEDAPAASEEAGDTAAAETPAAEETAVASTSSGIMGTVSFDGEPPARQPLDTKADPKCHAMHSDEPLLSEAEVVSEDGKIAHVFLYVSNPPDGDYEPPAEAVVLDQIGCTYNPHVFGVLTGQEISIKNSDDTLHNVRSFARRNAPFNLGQPAGSAPRSKTYKKEEEAIKFKCDVHPWMTAYMFVVEHPFFATTDADGKFEIAGLPAGEYNVTAWHEIYGEQEGTATVTADGPATLDFTFSR